MDSLPVEEDQTNSSSVRWRIVVWLALAAGGALIAWDVLATVRRSYPNVLRDHGYAIAGGVLTVLALISSISRRITGDDDDEMVSSGEDEEIVAGDKRAQRALKWVEEHV